MRMIDGIISREATVMAFNDVHLLMAAAFVLALFLLPAVRNTGPSDAPMH
jgi:MFS transporter, DHA2 family, multidrug resistance protein